MTHFSVEHQQYKAVSVGETSRRTSSGHQRKAYQVTVHPKFKSRDQSSRYNVALIKVRGRMNYYILYIFSQ